MFRADLDELSCIALLCLSRVSVVRICSYIIVFFVKVLVALLIAIVKQAGSVMDKEYI